MRLNVFTSAASLALRLQDGRWRTVSRGAAAWAFHDGRYEVERKGYATKNRWRPYGGGAMPPRTAFRARLRFEHVAEPFRSELLPRRRAER